MNKQTFLFDTICDDLVEKILEHKKINKEMKKNKSRATEGVSLELSTVYHNMWRKYDEFKFKPYADFINEDFTIGWHLAAIYNYKIYTMANSEDDDPNYEPSEEEIEYESESESD